MFLERIRERFDNFDDDFLYNGYYRDKKKKRTFIELECKKCNSILKKEQFDFLNVNKSLFCFECKDRKKPKPLNYDDIKIKFEENGCKVLKFKKNKMKGICKCGDFFIKNLYELEHFNCKKCSLNNRIFSNSYKEEDVRKWFLDNGLIPTFEKYNNANENLSYICICGNESTIRYSRRFSHDDDWKPMCKNCAMSLKTSGENHWNWKGGCKNTSKRYIDEQKWSKKVKKKFKNKCCISNESCNLVSHHLNAFNLNLGDHNNIDNGVCITYDLHVEFHNKYDKFKGTCTREDFEEFFFEKTNIKFENYLKYKLK